MATTPTPEYKGSLVLNEVDSFETYQEMLNKGLASEDNNEFYLLPDEDEYISYDPYPKKGSPNLVTSGGIYEHFEKSVEDSNAALTEATNKYNNLNAELEVAIENAVETISGEIDADIDEKISEVNNSINRVDNRVTDLGNLTIDKIGDIKATVRKDLNNSWLPCDGRNVSDEDYPEIFDLIGPKYDKVVNNAELPTSTSTPLFFIDGYWITHSKTQKSSGSYCATVFYTNDLSNPSWDSKDIWDSEDITDSYITDIKEVNGKILILGCKVNSDGKNIVIAELSNEFNVLNEKIIYTTTGAHIRIGNIAFNGEYYAILANYGTTSSKVYCYIFYSKTINGDWQSKQILSYSTVPAYYFSNLDFIDGVWVWTSEGFSKASIYFLPDFDSEVTSEVIINDSNTSATLYVNKIRQKDDYLFCTVNNTTYDNAAVYYKKITENSWTQSFVRGSFSGSVPSIAEVFYDGYNFVTGGRLEYKDDIYSPALAYSEKLENSNWNIESLDASNNTPSAIYYYDKKIVVDDGNTIFYTSGTYLPNISVEGVNHYIKVLEE